MMSPTSPECCEAFSRSSEIYDLIHAGKDYDGEAKRVLELLGPVPEMGKRYMVDWGCGTGQFTQRFRDAGWECYGVDSSQAMVNASRKTFVVHGDIMEAGTPGVVDYPTAAQTCLFAAFSYASASHPPLLILENFRKAAAPGGKLVFDFVNADAEIREYQERRVPLPDDRSLLIRQIKRLVDSRQIEINIGYSKQAAGGTFDFWEEYHYLRTFTMREMAELLSRAGWKLEKFVDLESQLPPESMSRYVASGEPYYLTAVCSAA